MSYLLGITIGPVQTFIEESKKLKDLENSSKIISDLMKKIDYFIKSNGIKVELIYPNMKNNLIEEIDFSNYAVYKCDEIIELSNLEEKIYEDKYELLKDNFYIFWAFKDFINESYITSYIELNRLVSNIKNTYEFDCKSEVSGKKCVICGKRNIINNYLELCPLCLYKRDYSRRDAVNQYGTVYSIAIKNWKEKYSDELAGFKNNLIDVNDDKFKIDKYYDINEVYNLLKIFSFWGKNIDDKLNLQEVIDRYKNRYKFEVRKLKELREDLVDKNCIYNNMINRLKEFKIELEAFYENNNIKKPSFEYVLIKFDMDNLGKWMSGEYIEDLEELSQKEFIEFQKDLSSALIKLGLKLKKEFAENKYCNVIYSGGDDFLAILSVEDIEKVLDIIEDNFENILRDNLKNYDLKENLTYSISITISQCQDSMSYSLIKNREDLKNIKEKFKNTQPKKDGVAITYIINNGKEIECYFKRNQIKLFFNLIKRYKAIDKKLSLSFINNFQQDFLIFNNKEMTSEEVRNLNQICIYELDRLIKRSCVVKNDTDINLFVIDIKDFFKKLFNVNTVEKYINCKVVNIQNICNTLILLGKLYGKIGEEEN